MTAPRFTAACAAALAVACAAPAQSLFQQPAEAPPPEGAAPGPPDTALYEVSLYAVKPPEPRTFEPNDLVTIIISENTELKRSQKVESEKDVSMSAEILELRALRRLLRLKNPLGDTVEADPILEATSDFEGEGEYEREDELTARVTGRVLEVKPNGLLLIEARTTVQTDGEVQSITLAGLCRPEDVTERNTVLSNQLSDLTLNIQNEGEVRKSTKKGVVTRVLETIFNF